ncbi:hypothetical protein DVS28_a4325 [Euzebya pacifica]|uniref:Uncharacterized protein n=1 Tax=Euzebya pacifica TaxID=1608957 RepID=A0A346Y3E4_9ACTN|nr:hypothetical protein [Euzebya pacifica]AXV08991.1 hypothetical protein DVS28_a4325 [Euzebya pacifica]
MELVFDHHHGRLLSFDEHPVEDAVTAYHRSEALYEADTHIEVLLVGSDFEATVRQTHPGFFRQEGYEPFGRLRDLAEAGLKASASEQVPQPITLSALLLAHQRNRRSAHR